MRRREFVALLSALTAGCVQDEPGSNDTNSTDDGNVTGSVNNTTDGAGNTTDDESVAIPDDESVVDAVQEFGKDQAAESVVDTPTGYAVAGFSDEIIQPVSYVAYLVNGGNGPVTLETKVANTGDSATTVPFAALPPRRELARNEDGGVLYAVPTESHNLVDEPPSIERDSDSWYPDGENDDELPDDVELAPGTGYTGVYALVTDEGELSEGTYSFGGEPTVHVWRADLPGPSEESRFAGRDFSDYSLTTPEFDITQEMLWYHEADETTAIYLQPSAESVEPSATVGFTLVNRSRGDFVDYSGWSLYKLVDGEWAFVAGDGSSTTVDVFPGETDKSEITVVHDDEATDERSTVRLGGGTYAYHRGYTYETDPGYHRGKTYESNVLEERFAAVFEVDAPEIDVEPPDDAEAERDGSTVNVTQTGELRRTGAFVVERVDEGNWRVTPESLYNVEEWLRYAVPYFEEGIDRVRVEADGETLTSAVTHRTYEYGGEAYRVFYEDV